MRLTIVLPGADKRVTAKLKAGCTYSVTVKLPARAAGRKATVKVDLRGARRAAQAQRQALRKRRRLSASTSVASSAGKCPP